MFELADAVGNTAATSTMLVAAIAYGLIFTGLSLFACAAIALGLIRGGRDE